MPYMVYYQCHVDRITHAGNTCCSHPKHAYNVSSVKEYATCWLIAIVPFTAHWLAPLTFAFMGLRFTKGTQHAKMSLKRPYLRLHYILDITRFNSTLGSAKCPILLSLNLNIQNGLQGHCSIMWFKRVNYGLWSRATYYRERNNEQVYGKSLDFMPQRPPRLGR